MKDVVLIRSIANLVDVAAAEGVDEAELVRGLSFDHKSFREAGLYDRIPWNEFVTYVERLNVAVGGRLPELVGEEFNRKNPFETFFRVGGVLISGQMYFWMANHVVAPLVFPALTIEEHHSSPRRMEFTGRISPELKGSEEFFRVSAAMMARGTARMGLPKTRVQVEVFDDGHRGEFVVDLPPSLSLLSRGRRIIDVVRGGRGFTEELLEQNEVVRRGYNELRASEESFRVLVESSPDGILIYDAGEVVVYANEALLALLGRSESEVVDAELSELFEQPERLANASEMEPHGLTLQGADGKPMQVETSTVGARFMGRDVMVTTLRDVSVRNEWLARAVDMDRLITMGTLAAGVAHEINNPITVVQANLAYLEEAVESLDEDQAAALKDAMAAADRVASITRELKDVGKPQDERLRAVDLREVAGQALRWVKPALVDRARLEKELDDPVMGMTDPGRLEQVVVNLLLNATQAIPPGRRGEHSVVISARNDGDWAVIEVLDTGSGITEEGLLRLFDPFYTTKPRGQGTGLGLFVSRDIIARLGGELEFESEVGVGTVARMRVPRVSGG